MWRATPKDGPEVALVFRPRYGDWTLPKGKLEPGESTRVAAWREVHEETGARVALGRHLGRTRYRAGVDRKVVDYFAARYDDGEFVPSDEVSTIKWLPVEEAKAALSYERDRPILTAFTALPPALTMLLLVRHAKAGSRAEWDGADEDRPLSRSGRKQVPLVGRLAEVCGGDRVHSAPLVRCVDTVAPIATGLGVPVVPEELLTEKAYVGSEDLAVRRVLDLVAEGGTPVVCSQGGVIPDLVRRLVTAPGVLGRHVESKKGSVWALFFADGTVRAADYIRTP